MDAEHIIVDVQRELQDDGTRWPVAELVDYLNDGQRQAVEMNPASTAEVASMSLAAGVPQDAPIGVYRVLDVLRNGAPRNTPVRLVDATLLDAVDPRWRQRAQALEIVHWMFDASLPTSFDVYPPASSGATLWCKFSMVPDDVPAPAGPKPDDVTGSISLRDEYASALRHYILYRCWSKDAEFAGNANLAQAHYSLFVSAIGADVAARAAETQTKEQGR